MENAPHRSFALPAASTGPGEFFQYAHALMTGGGQRAAAIADFEARRGSPRVLAVMKAASAAGTTTDADWAASLADYRAIESAFAESLKPFSALDAMLQFMRKVPLRTRLVSVTTTATASEVGEVQPKPVSSMSLNPGDLELRKVVAMVAISRELAESPGAQNFIGRELQKSVGIASDGVFLASLDATEIAASADPAADLAEAAGLMTISAGSRLFLVLPAPILAAMALQTVAGGGFRFPNLSVTGGTIGGIIAAPTSAETEDAVLIDASQAVAAVQPVTLDYADHASLELNDAPTGSGPLTSLWQSNLRGIRAERWFATQAGDGAAVRITDVDAWAA